ncbi:SUMF1/EgtB/PvdO family nonheme iron enzyme [uncultured Thiohalocapsa sp.]|uniref:formylglycine-generating enzyme family protein n=1 Tax=uncultured Thiohalocapsa sp. TaxID=768990 RepID=UPI0025DA8157|nr:SUMF1/EgtB/PvdO family nonheme iron enzyme [uncultured Thiohalocapsa sp.]
MDRPALWDDPRFDNPSQPVVGVNWLKARACGRWLGDLPAPRCRCRRGSRGSRGAGADLLQGACRLSTEAEWERATRAGARRRGDPWPGGGGFSADRANCVEGQVLATTPVGCYSAGAGALGIEDLAGNCWEWRASRYRLYPLRPGDGRDDPAGTDPRVLRGGA